MGIITGGVILFSHGHYYKICRLFNQERIIWTLFVMRRVGWGDYILGDVCFLSRKYMFGDDY